MRTYALVFLALFLNIISIDTSAQFVDSASLLRYLSQSTYSIDSDAAAIVLYERTTSEISISDNVRFRNEYSQKLVIRKVIKILKRSALFKASISTGILRSFEKVDSIGGTTYTITNGKVEMAILSKDATYKKQYNYGRYEMLFSLPKVKDGDIIDYQYEISSPVLNGLWPWLIEEKLPKLKSEYVITIPPGYNYNLFQQGGLSFTEIKDLKDADTVENGYHICLATAAKDRYQHIWGRKNIPAFPDEPYVNSPYSYAKRMDIELSQYVKFTKKTIVHAWADINDGLWIDKYFGEKAEKVNRAYNKLLDSLLSSKDSRLKKAKNIYDYVRGNFECNSRYNIYSYTDFFDLIKNRKGSVGDINLLLTAMLNSAGYEASPVVLRRNGTLQLYENYPMKNRLNYVICRVRIDSVYYYLDATYKYNAFGVLPDDCYSGYARVISRKGEGIYLLPDGVKNKEVMIINVSGLDDSIMQMDFSQKAGFYLSASLRHKWLEDSSEFKKNLEKEAQNWGDLVSMDNLQLINLNDFDTNLIVKYTFRLKNANWSNMNYINTDPIKQFTKNPFKSIQRKLPVEFPFKMENTNVLNMIIPDNYVIVDLPKSDYLSFEDDQMLFKHHISYDSTTRRMSVNTFFKVDNTEFKPEGYEVLRNFFEKMVEDENQVITFKKHDK